MNIVTVSPVRLVGDGIAACLKGNSDLRVIASVTQFSMLREILSKAPVDVALIDISHDILLDDVRAIAADWPDVALIAFGLNERQQEVTRCAQAGFVGYVAREGSVEALCAAVSNARSGCLACPAEIAGGLMRALFRFVPAPQISAHNESLTCREEDVLRLLGRGASNKEIARELSLSVSTVKHHVHHILSKLQMSGRAQAMRRVRDEPWMAPSAHSEKH